MTASSRALALRPSGRARARIALGVLLAVVSVGAILLVFSTVDRRVPVLQLVHDVPAGSIITAADLRVVEVSADPTLQVIGADQLQFVVGRYTKVRLVAGSLLASPALQLQPLLAPGAAVVAVLVAPGELPAGLRERSHVRIVLPDDTATTPVTGEVSAPRSVDGRVVGLPTSPDAVTGSVSVSIELSEADAVLLAASAGGRIVLLDPAGDPAETPGSTTPTTAGSVTT